ncbi:MAG: M48 family metallopeptidase [Deferribacteraceae bacterium]|jgi:predicted metal-dependent hydrolase|nr:M48 family metallopeptidase [Deferribacteraceae bacterium]
MINYTLTRARRKTLALYVRNGAVEVRAPLKISKAEIERFVASKKRWIEIKLTGSNEQMLQRKNFRLYYGGYVTYCGKLYLIAAKEGNLRGFDGKQFFMPPDLSPEQIKTACVQIYRNLAKHILTDKTFAFAKRMAVNPATVKINGAKTRWGSCSVRRNINFSWRLVMADEEIIDYVVVHELAHIKEMNHSARFWAIVENILPDWRVKKMKLKDLQRRLSGEDWKIKKM